MRSNPLDIPFHPLTCDAQFLKGTQALCMNTDAFKLLWTGGWDSSFRLLQIVVIEKRSVQPIYVFDAERRSLAHEIRAMKKMLELTRSMFPDLSSSIGGPQFIFVDKSIGNTEVDRYFEEFRSVCHIGEQYHWLAKAAGQCGYSDLELCVEKDADQAAIAGTWLAIVEPYFSGVGHDCKIDVDSLDDEKIKLFKYYRFPVAHLTKREMADISREYGFYDIIKHSWFCHSPILNRPCGQCQPCQLARTNGNYTVHEPVSRRISVANRYLNAIIRRLKLETEA